MTCFATAQASPRLKNLKCFCLSQNVAQKGCESKSLFEQVRVLIYNILG